MAIYSTRRYRHPVIPKAVTRATSLLKVDFGGSLAIGNAYTVPAAGAADSRNFFKDFTGTDGEGNVWPTAFQSLFGAGVQTTIQAIPSENISGANDTAKALVLNGLFNHEIRTLDTPVNGKTKYLHNQITARTTTIGDSPAPQTDPAIIRSSSVTNELKRLCIRSVIRLPANLNDLLVTSPANANWLIVNDIKKGNYLSQNGKGDYRLKLQINKDSSGLYWRMVGDNSANGAGVIPSLEADNSGTGGFWNINADNTQVPVFLDEWLEIYLFIKSPELYWTRETPGNANTPYVRDLTTGRTVAVMHRISTGQWYLIGDQVGGKQVGSENLIWTRFFFLTYCNANVPVYVDTLEIEFFDNLPFTLESKGLA